MTHAALRGANSPAAIEVVLPPPPLPLRHFSDLGLELHFQDGPIGTHGVNGTTNEAVIQVLIDRLNSFQEMSERKFYCRENALAIAHLEEAMHWLQARTAKRVQRGVEGTNTP